MLSDAEYVRNLTVEKIVEDFNPTGKKTASWGAKFVHPSRDIVANIYAMARANVFYERCSGSSNEPDEKFPCFYTKTHRIEG